MKTRIVQNEPDGRAAADQSATESGPVDDQAGSSSPTGWTRFRGFVRRYELVIFFALSYLIAWSTLPFGSFLAFSPLFSALIVVAIAEGWRGLAQLGRRLIRWRVNWIWYAAAIGLPLLVHAVAVGLNMAAGAPAPSLAQFQPWYAVLMVFGLRPPRSVDHLLALATCLHAAIRPWLPGHWIDCAGHLLVRLAVQPDRWQCAVPAHRSRH